MRHRQVIALLGGLAALMLAGWALAQVGRTVLAGAWVLALDGGVTAYLSERRTGALTYAMVAATTLGDVWLVGVLVLALGLGHRLRHGHWRALWVLAVAGAGALSVSVAVKSSTGRSRPPEPYALVEAVGSAFPSGHSLRAIAVYGALAWLAAAVAAGRARRVAIWTGSAVVVLAVGLSRVYLGAHWLTDVLVGYALGALWLWLVVAVASPRRSVAEAGDQAARQPSGQQPEASRIALRTDDEGDDDGHERAERHEHRGGEHGGAPGAGPPQASQGRPRRLPGMPAQGLPLVGTQVARVDAQVRGGVQRRPEGVEPSILKVSQEALGHVQVPRRLVERDPALLPSASQDPPDALPQARTSVLTCRPPGGPSRRRAHAGVL